MNRTNGKAYCENSATKANEEMCQLNSEIQTYGRVWETSDDKTRNMKILSNAQKIDTLRCQ